MKFKVKRHWWMWALGALGHIFAACLLRIDLWQVLAVLIVLDFLVVFPDASHIGYDIENRQFTVRRFLLYSDISFPTASIVSVDNATLFTMPGGARTANFTDLKIYSESFGAFEIIYSISPGAVSRRKKKVVVGPADRQAFLDELRLNVDPQVILINNQESAFKKKKDEQ